MKKLLMVMAASGVLIAGVVHVRAGADGVKPGGDGVKPAEVAGKQVAAKADGESSTKGPRIGVEPASFHFGKALQHKTLTKEFSVRNLGTEDLVISNVATTCGCTAAQLVTPKTLKPGASTPLVVSLETRAYTGKLERIVSIASNDPEKVLQLKVSAEVESNQGTGAPISNK